MDDKFLDSYALIKTENTELRMNKKLSIVSLILLLFNTSACKPLPSAVFRDESCFPPCWNQIMPGQTYFKDINAKLRLTQDIDSTSIKSITILRSNDGISFNFLPTVREHGGRIFSQNGIVQAILFWPKANEFLLSDGLEIWGSPDRYLSIYYSKAETPYLVTIIVFIDKGTILESRKAMSTKDTPRFEKNLPIDDFWYINPDLINSLLEDGPIAHIDNQDLLDSIRPWSGFEEIIYLTKDH